MAKGIAIYRKETINRHLKVKDHLIVEKKQKEKGTKMEEERERKLKRKRNEIK